MSFALVAVGAIGAAKLVAGGIARGKAKKAQTTAKDKMEADKEKYMNMPVENPYEGMENTMEDLTVNTQAAEFASQKSAQNRANTMDKLMGAAGGSGIAALAQTMANQGQIEAQEASASIASQEAANQKAERGEAGNIQKLEREGEIQKGNMERDKMATALGMSQGEVMATNQNVSDANAMMMSGASDVGSAVGGIGG